MDACLSAAYERTSAQVLAGLLALAGVAAAIYLLSPWWRIRRRRLVPLPAAAHPDLAAELDALVRRAGVDAASG